MTPKLGCKFDPQQWCQKLAMEARACHLRAGEAETRGTWGSLASQPSGMGEPQARESPCLKSQGGQFLRKHKVDL